MPGGLAGVAAACLTIPSVNFARSRSKASPPPQPPPPPRLSHRGFRVSNWSANPSMTTLIFHGSGHDYGQYSDPASLASRAGGTAREPNEPN